MYCKIRYPCPIIDHFLIYFLPLPPLIYFLFFPYFGSALLCETDCIKKRDIKL